MSADSSPRLPTVAIATIGHHRHGKTTLTAAITRVLARRAGLAVPPRTIEELDRRGGSPPVELFGGQLSPRPGTFHGVPETLTVRGTSLRYETARRAFVHFDAPGRRPWLRNVARALADVDAALLVVSAADSVQPQTIEHLRLARALGVTRLVVFLGKCDLVADLDWLDLVERDVRDLLDRCGYDGDATRPRPPDHRQPPPLHRPRLPAAPWPARARRGPSARRLDRLRPRAGHRVRDRASPRSPTAPAHPRDSPPTNSTRASEPRARGWRARPGARADR